MGKDIPCNSNHKKAVTGIVIYEVDFDITSINRDKRDIS